MGTSDGRRGVAPAGTVGQMVYDRTGAGPPEGPRGEMMFRVRWEQIARNQLATLWLEADSRTRKAVTSATHRIDQQLRADPLEHSESGPGGRRILFISPLGILFRVENDRQMVSVLRVWLFRRSSQP